MSTTAPLNDLDAVLRRLHLPTIRRPYPDLVLRAEAEGMSYRDFLEILVSQEIAHRAQTRITRSVRKAKFPFLRTIEEFDFTFQSSVRLQMLGTLLGPELVSEGRCAILSGPPGRGKTHLGVAIAYRAIQNGFEARFTTADELIGELSHAAQQHWPIAILGDPKYDPLQSPPYPPYANVYLQRGPVRNVIKCWDRSYEGANPACFVETLRALLSSQGVGRSEMYAITTNDVVTLGAGSRQSWGGRPAGEAGRRTNAFTMVIL